MDVQRASKISEQFSSIKGCEVEVWTHGLLVRVDGQTSYFTREECFWPFVFRMAGIVDASAVAEIESHMQARQRMAGA